MVYDDLKVVFRQVGFVGADFLHHEASARRFDERLEVVSVVRVTLRDFNRRDDVRLDAAHQVNLDPIALRHDFRIAVLRVNPLVKATGRKARRVNRKLGLNRLQRQTAFLNEHCEHWRQRRVFEIARNRIVVRRLREMALVLCVAQIGHEAPTGHARINLERAGENNIGKRQCWTVCSLWWFVYAVAQVSEQLDKLFFFAALRFVVAAPFLLVGFLYNESFGQGLSLTVIGVFALNGKRDREQMLAGLLSCLKVRASASTTYLPLPACDGTSQSSPSRTSLVLAAISSPLISRASMSG